MTLGWVWWRAWAPLVARGAAALFAWQAWHLATSTSRSVWHLASSTFVSRGRRCTWRHRSRFCVVGVALIGLGWVWWRAWAPLVARGAAALLCGRRGIWRHPPSFWHAWRLASSTFVSGGRCGTYDTGMGLVARLGAVGRPWRRGTFAWQAWRLANIHLRFAWQAWRLASSTFTWQAWHL